MDVTFQVEQRERTTNISRLSNGETTHKPTTRLKADPLVTLTLFSQDFWNLFFF